MLSSLTIIAALALAGGSTVESACRQVAPAPADGKWTRTQPQAVVLLHGYYYHPFGINVPKAEFRSWQQPSAALVKELGKSADVYVFAYGQNVPLDVIVRDSKLPGCVADLRKLGYGEITLMGHSAGGLIARHFVEDFPDAGVTKVVQISAPNGGSPLASLVVTKAHKPFADCLTEKSRQQCLRDRVGKAIPDAVQFVCVVSRDGGKATDGVVPCQCQWTADLQAQGIPAVTVSSGHLEVVRDAKTAEFLARIIRTPHARWPAERVEQARTEIFGPPPRTGVLTRPSPSNRPQ